MRGSLPGVQRDFVPMVGVHKRRPSRNCGCFVAWLAMTSVAIADPDSPAKENPPAKPLLTIEVVDPDGRPVEGALVGQRIVSTVEGQPPRLYGLDDPGQQQSTDRDGLFHLFDAEIAGHLNERDLLICAYHPERKLIAIERLNSKDLGATKRITLAPGCNVTAAITSSELEQLGRPIEMRKILASWNGIICGYWHRFDARISLVLPPGEYFFLGG